MRRRALDAALLLIAALIAAAHAHHIAVLAARYLEARQAARFAPCDVNQLIADRERLAAAADPDRWMSSPERTPMNPLAMFVLYTYEAAPGMAPGCRAYLFLDEPAATAAGEKLKAEKPAEVTEFTYMVLPLEGAPA